MAIAPSITTNLEFAIEFGESSLWQDSARTTSATTSDPVGAMDDQSGNARHATQTTTSYKPIVGASSVELDGTDDYLSMDGTKLIVGGKNDWTLYIACELYTFPGTYNTIFSAGETAGVDYPVLNIYVYGGSDQWRTHLRTTNNVNQWGSAAVAVSAGKQVVVIKGTSTTVGVYQGGSLASESTIDAGSFDFDVVSIGAQVRASSTREIEMDLYGAYLYSSAHGSSDMATITSDLEAMLGLGGATVSPSVISLGSVPNVSIDSLYTISPSVVSLGSTIENPSVSNFVTVSPSVISLGTVESPAILEGVVTVSPSVISLGTIESPSVQRGATTINPSIISLGTVESPAIQEGATTINPSVISLGTIESPSVQRGATTVSPNVISLGTILNPSVQEGGVETLLPTTIINSPTIPNVSIQSIYTVSPSVVSLGSTIESPSVQRGTTTINPSIISLGTVESPAILEGATTINPSIISLGTIESPSVQRGAITVNPSIISLSPSITSPTVSNVVTVVPSIISLGTIESPSVQRGATTISPSIISLNPAVYNVTINPSETDEDSKLDFIFFAIRRK